MITARRTSRQRIAGLAVAAVVACVFGPYTPIAGVRTEQMAVYGLCGLCLLFAAHSLLHAPPAAILVLFLLAAQFGVSAAAAIGPAPGGVAQFSVGAGLDTLALPMAVIVMTVIVTRGTVDLERLVRVIGAVLIVGLSLNSVVAYLMLTGNESLTPVLAGFWVADPSGQSTAANAATMGRFSGVFNQPAEAGVMYSIGLVLAVGLFGRRGLLLASAGVLLTIGGLITASKVFLLVGLPVALWLLWRWHGWKGRMYSLLVVVVVMGIYDHQARQSSEKIGGVLLDTWLNPDQTGSGLVAVYSAGRYGDQSSLSGVVDTVLRHAPWFGYGLGGVSAAYDSGWVEALALAGVFGIIVHGLLWVVLATHWLSLRRYVSPAVRQVGGAVLLIVAVGDLGLPTLTANRVAAVVWLLLCLTIVCPIASGAAAGGRHRLPDVERWEEARVPIPRPRQAVTAPTPLRPVAAAVGRDDPRRPRPRPGAVRSAHLPPR